MEDNEEFSLSGEFDFYEDSIYDDYTAWLEKSNELGKRIENGVIAETADNDVKDFGLYAYEEGVRKTLERILKATNFSQVRIR